MSDISSQLRNLQNEFMLVGAIYKNPELLVEYEPHIKSKYDFDDPSTRFFYDHAVIMYKTRSQTFNQAVVTAYMTEDPERFTLYQKHKAWEAISLWMELADVDNFKNYFEIVKKYSLLREYYRNGFNVEKILNHPKFEIFTAVDIYRMIRSKADRIHTVVLTNNESEILNENLVQLLDTCLEIPDMGLELPFPIMTELFRGIRLNTMMCNAALSNSGKSRYMFVIVAYLALVLKQKVCVLLNEMSIKDMRFCLLSTVINNEYFQKLHGYKIQKNERELTLGLYRDRNGELIYRKTDEEGNYIESAEEYKKRIAEESDEYNIILQIAKWVENETDGLIFAKDVSDGYDDITLTHEIRKHNIVHGVQYFFYDTLKNDISAVGDWAALKVTVTKLFQLTTELNCFIFGSIQLTDDCNHIEPLMMSSSLIAECKAIKHVLDSLTMFKHLKKDEYSKYYWLDEAAWGAPIKRELDLSKRYVIFVIDKNRAGDKIPLLFEIDLDKNIWKELGRVFKK